MSLNKCIFIGNMVRDPQLRYTPSQTAVTEFSIAVNRKFKAQSGEMREEVAYLDCQAWGKTGEVINQHFSKGKPILVESRAEFESWEDRNGGGKRSKIVFVVENFEFVGGNGGGQQRPPNGDDEDQRMPDDW